MRLICRVLWIIVYPILKLLEPCIQRWVKPTNQSLVLGTVADLTRGRAELVLENAFLRQQVIVFSREKKRPALTNQDLRLLVLFARLLPSWKKGASKGCQATLARMAARAVTSSHWPLK